ncbi:GNAT family N-acetyltransferase [Longispora sp. K20-0274]|uniref:GNAT family N-acetyltransferase n=1 Tax=Longispora sp. K20-0274 TaxID=3088255 RepID=UPI003999EFF8
MSFEDVTRRWLAGWTPARGLTAAERVPDGLRTTVGDAWREYETFALTDEPGALRRLAAGLLPRPRVEWLTVATDRVAETEAVLTGAGLEVFERPEQLMGVELADQPRHSPAGPYRLRITEGDSSVGVTVLAGDGTEAARGWIGLAGTDAIVDRILTEPEHRRRGLGSVVMTALAGAALDRGARTGLLIASTDGQALYGRLGWHRLADVRIAAYPA